MSDYRRDCSLALEEAADEIERLRQHVEELQAKVGDEDCACSYDEPGIMCVVHSPMLKKAEAEIERLRKEVVYWHHRYTEVCMGFARPIDPWAKVPEDEGFDGPQGAN